MTESKLLHEALTYLRDYVTESHNQAILDRAILSLDTHFGDMGVTQEMVDLLRQGHYILAIKLHKEVNGTGLVEAKRIIDSVRESLGLSSHRT